jgi:uncharacterized protein (DUF362 family)
MRLFRRGFLVLLGLFAAAGFVLFRWWDPVKHLLFGPASMPAPSPTFSNLPKRNGKSLISLVGGENVEGMVQRAVDLLGGWETIGVQGKRVLVKPNVVSGDGPPTTTNPKVVGAIVKSLYQAGASQVIVGDMSALMTLPTRDNMKQTGIAGAARRAGARVVFFEDHSWRKVDTGRAQYLSSVSVSEWVLAVDRVVNVPVVKTHHSAIYSAALKNFVGATHGRQRPYLVDSDHWEEVVAELNLAYAPHLNLVDATTVMVSGGPWRGESRSPNLVYASGDRIVADLAALALIKHYGLWPQVAAQPIREQRQIKRAAALGLGVSSPQGIELLTENLGLDQGVFEELTESLERFGGLAANRQGPASPEGEP